MPVHVCKLCITPTADESNYEPSAEENSLISKNTNMISSSSKYDDLLLEHASVKAMGMWVSACCIYAIMYSIAEPKDCNSNTPCLSSHSSLVLHFHCIKAVINNGLMETVIIY